MLPNNKFLAWNKFLFYGISIAFLITGTAFENNSISLAAQRPADVISTDPSLVEELQVPKKGLFRKYVSEVEEIILLNLPEETSIRMVVKGSQSHHLIALDGLKWSEVKSYANSDVTQYSFMSQGTTASFRLPANGGYHISVFPPSAPEIQSASSNDHYNPDPNSDPEFLVKDVLIGGDCFDVNNISLSSRPTSAGTFSAGLSSIGIDEGVVLATGTVDIGVGPNDITDAGTDDVGGANDPDLRQVVSELFQGSNPPIFDATILEFEFTPTVDSITFEYVFASEEYCDYVNSQFNDVFGFFISGPGINGNFSNNGENIAVVPGTNDYVSINTLNINSNPAFYVDNVPLGQPQGAGGCTSEPNTASPTSDFIQYDGFSTPLQAIASVVPCETYTIKLAVADVGDGFFDSAVMLKAGSFQAGGTALLDVESDLGGNVFLQGCTDGGFTVRRGNTNNFNEPFEVTLTIDPSSTAEPGVDYEPFDTVIVIPALSMEVFVDLVTLPQFVYDGEEKTIILVLDNSCSCEIEETVIIIEPVPPLESDLQGDTVCLGSPVFFDPSEEVYPGVDYQWSDGQLGPGITVYPLESGFYSVTLSNACEELVDSAYVEVVNPPSAFMNADTAVCEDDLSNIDLTISFEGRGPFTFSYTINGESYLVRDFEDSIYMIPPNHRDTGSYRINFMDGYLECQGEIEGGGEVQYRELLFDVMIEDASCGGNADGQIEIIPDSTSLPYTYLWEDGSETSVRDSLSVGQYNLTLTDGPGCRLDTFFQIAESSDVDYLAEVTRYPTCQNNSGALRLQIDSSDFQEIRWSTGDSSLMIDSLSPGVYSFFIETFTDCDIQDSILVPDPPALPIIRLDSIIPIQCDRDTGQIFIEVDAQSSWTLRWSNSDTIQNLGATIPGMYQVEVTDSLGCLAELQVNLPIDTLYPSIDLPDPAFLSCVDSALTLEFDSTNWSQTQLTWVTDTDSIISRSDREIRFSESGLYRVELLDTTNGCITYDSLRIRDPQLPTVELLPLDTLNCETSAVDIGVSHNESHLRFYIIDQISGDTLDQSAGSELSVSQLGSYQLIAIDTLSLCQTDTLFEVSQDLESPGLVLPDSVLLQCRDSVLRLEAEIQGNNSYYFEWRNENDDILDSGQLPGETEIVYETSSTGIYYLVVRDNKTACLSRDTIEVIPDTNLPTVIVQTPQQITCDQQEIEVLAQGSSSGDEYYYRWLSEGGDLIGDDVEQLTVDSGGTYILSIQNTDNGCIEQTEFVVEENVFPPSLSADLGEPFTCLRQTVNWQYTGPDSIPVEIGWYLNGLREGVGPTFSIAAGEAADSYSMRVERLDNGCADSLMLVPQWDTIAPIAIVDSVPTLPCNNESISLSAMGSTPEGELDFEWRRAGTTLSQLPQVEVSEEGTYEIIVQIQRNGCKDSMSVAVTSIPIVDFDIAVDPLLCTRPFGEVQVGEVSGGTAPYTFSLNGSERENEGFFSDLDPGSYTLNLRDALGCEAERSFQIDSLSDLEIDLIADLVLDYDDRYQIDLTVNRPDDEITFVEWSPDEYLSCSQCLRPWLTAREDQEIRVLLEDIYGCTAEAILRLVVEINPQIFIPNVFSPNGDGINDDFFPNAGPTVINIPEMLVFDRWGNLLFEQQDFPPNSPQMGWNGRYKGQILKPAVFAYLIKVELVTGDILTLTGDVTLVK